MLFGTAYHTVASAQQEPKPKPPAVKPRLKPAAAAPEAAPPATEPQRPVPAAPVALPPAPRAEPPEPPVFRELLPEELALGYPIGVGDVLRVIVFQQPDMTVETRVSEVGTISFPLLGQVQVSGITARLVEERIATLLRSRGFVRDPQVVATVLQFKSRQVAVLGQVNRPGRYALEEGVYRLTDVLALAGGTIPDSADVVTLVRVAGGKTAKYEIDLPGLFRAGDFSNNPEVLAGDTIHVARAPMFYIYGEVTRPGAFRLEKDMTLMQALSMGGGITLRGTEKNIQIRRRSGNGQYTTLTGAPGDAIQRDDVIFVRQSLF
jgi:polysaccharide export outer membrane protein